MSLLTGTQQHLEALADGDLVIEAVFEDMASRRRFSEARSHRRPARSSRYQHFGVSTSTKSRASRNGPEAVIGPHFFTPANVMRLLEIVRGEDVPERHRDFDGACEEDRQGCFGGRVSRASSAIASSCTPASSRRRRCSWKARCRGTSTRCCTTSACRWGRSQCRMASISAGTRRSRAARQCARRLAHCRAARLLLVPADVEAGEVRTSGTGPSGSRSRRAPSMSHGIAPSHEQALACCAAGVQHAVADEAGAHADQRRDLADLLRRDPSRWR